MWETIQYVATPVSLVAFIVAVGASIYNNYLRRAERLISQAPESSRGPLVQGALDLLKIDTNKFDSDQLFELAQSTLQEKRQRFRLIMMFATALAFLTLALAFYAIYVNWASPESKVKRAFDADAKDLLMKALSEQDILSIRDPKLESALAREVELTAAERQRSAAETIAILNEKVNSNPALVGLRRRAERYEIPFQRIDEIMLVGVPEFRDNQPQRYFANVSMSSDLAWRRIRVKAPSGKYLVLLARPSIDDSIEDVRVSIHLNQEQAMYLFDDKYPHSVSQLYVIDYPDAQGMLFDPVCSIDKRRKRYLPRAEKLCTLEEQVDSATVTDLFGGS